MVYKIYKSHYLSKSDLKRKFYNKYSNTLSRCIEISKRNYYKNKLNEVKDNVKDTWKLINNIINLKKMNKAKIQLRIDNNLISDPSIVANHFSKFFHEIGPKLAEKIPHSQDRPDDFLGESISSSFYLHETNEMEVYEIINKLKRKISTGIDGLDNNLMRVASTVISKHLSLIFNRSFTTGIFPDRLKEAKIIPIFKKGSAENISNYRPISLLSSVSKVLEKIIHSRLISFLNKFNILYEYQFG